MSTLYLVATPIGNLEDITYRAVQVLRSVPVIAAEDTRTTGVLLKKHYISTPMISYHDHSRGTKVEELLDRLEKGDVALVSDAGSPGINDPGYTLINAALQAGHQVSPLPGPSAPIAALTASGLPTDSFLYLGYLPRKSTQRQKLLADYQAFPHTLVALETPHRVESALTDIREVLGDRRIAVARELTKLHEEILRGTVSEIQDHFQRQTPRGEITLVIAGLDPSEQRWSEEKLRAALKEAVQEGSRKPSRIARAIARKSGWKRNEVYDVLQDIS
jgi:16S rRNA (cytidine1402-2'-O)-methyltransferase